MDDLLKALAGEEAPFCMTNEERLMLIDLLVAFSSVLSEERIMIDDSKTRTMKYAEFALDMARRFTNMTIETEH